MFKIRLTVPRAHNREVKRVSYQSQGDAAKHVRDLLDDLRTEPTTAVEITEGESLAGETQMTLSRYIELMTRPRGILDDVLRTLGDAEQQAFDLVPAVFRVDSSVTWAHGDAVRCGTVIRHTGFNWRSAGLLVRTSRGSEVRVAIAKVLRE